MDLFNFEFEQPQHDDIYATSLDSTTESLPDLEEVKTPLLYDSKISASRSCSIASTSSDYISNFDESFIDQLDIQSEVIKTTDQFFKPDQYKLNLHSASTVSSSLNMPFTQVADHTISETISKGTSHLKNNYKIWLSNKAL